MSQYYIGELMYTDFGDKAAKHKLRFNDELMLDV
jgi:hypothetical protein